MDYHQKKTPEHDSSLGSAGCSPHVCIKRLRTSVNLDHCSLPPQAIVNMFLIHSSSHLSFSIGYSRTDYLGYNFKDWHYKKDMDYICEKYDNWFGYRFQFILYVCSDLQSAK